jgi:Tfp pilus assembly protein PilV
MNPFTSANNGKRSHRKVRCEAQKEHRRKQRSGMTLVEVLVFTGLSFLVMGVALSAASQAYKFGIATEEQLAAFAYNKSWLEKERANFNIADYSYDTNLGFYNRRELNITFYTTETPQGEIEVTGTRIINLAPVSTGQGNGYRATVQLIWPAKGSQSRNLTNTVQTILYP